MRRSPVPYIDMKHPPGIQMRDAETQAQSPCQEEDAASEDRGEAKKGLLVIDHQTISLHFGRLSFLQRAKIGEESHLINYNILRFGSIEGNFTLLSPYMGH